ncbi:MAG: hypothetical protein LBH77_04430 [Tannerella sp.]|jgi:hypothetical protein|nr:hypothetical protein [Tannerella sp.]
MNKFFIIYTITIFALLSCNKNDISSSIKEEQDIISTNYSFVNIEFIINEYYEEKDVIKQNSPITIYNNSGITQTYTFYPQKNISEVSTFYSSDTRAFSFIDGQQYIKIPVTMFEDGTLIYDDGIRWAYTKEQKLRPILDSYNTITIKPNHILKLTASFHLKVINTEYKLHLIGVEFGEKTAVNGLWSGVFLQSYEIDYTVEPYETK